MFTIRSAKKSDSELILRYIKELAIAEEFPFEVSVTKEEIEANLFSSSPAAEVVILYRDDMSCGFAIFYHTFSTTTGKRGLHLDDLYIQPEYQGQGLGTKVFGYLARLAIQRNCARFEWWALKTNDAAIKFYKNMGAKDLDEISVFRLDIERIREVAANN